MKYRNYRRLVALALFVLALNTMVLAQDFISKIRVNIPFSFYAGDKMLPAGQYTFALNRANSNIAIRGEDQAAGAFLFGSPNSFSNGGNATLTFRTDGNGGYVLEKFQGPDFGFAFANRRNSAKVAANDPKSQPSHDTQVVVARLIK